MKKVAISLALAMAAIVLLSPIAVSASATSTVSAVGSPAVISMNGTNLNLFIRGSDGNIYTRNASDGVTWGNSTSLGAPIVGATSDPSVINDSGNMTVFVRGGDGTIYSTTSNATNWTDNAWAQYGGSNYQLMANTTPSFVNATTVFVTGNNSHLYQGTLNATTGNFTWLNLGGTLTSSPSATLTSTGITVFVGGTSGNLWSITNTAGVWASYQPISGQLLAGTSPAAYSWSNGRVGLLVAGQTNELYHRWWQGTTASGWENLGGYLTTPPGATAKSTGNVDVFATGALNQTTGTATIYQKSYTPGAPNYGWGNWTAIGGL